MRRKGQPNASAPQAAGSCLDGLFRLRRNHKVPVADREAVHRAIIARNLARGISIRQHANTTGSSYGRIRDLSAAANVLGGRGYARRRRRT